MPELLNNDSFLEQIFIDEKKSKEFQKFLKKNLLSSHAWVLAQKK